MQGSSSFTYYTNYMDSAYISDLPIYNIQHECSPKSSFSILIHQSPLAFPKGITNKISKLQYQITILLLRKQRIYFLCLVVNCVQGLNLWRNSSSDVNRELFKGYRKGNLEEKINEFAAGLSLLSHLTSLSIVS